MKFRSQARWRAVWIIFVMQNTYGMLTKFILHIDGEDYELREDDLRNWEDVKCSRTRSDYGGVVRSFTSQFEFVNNAMSKLRAVYLRDGFGSSASVSVHTLTNSWRYEERFRCHLDFSTVSWEGGVLKMNAVDDSLAALLKANRSTKYEYAVGTDIVPDMSVRFDRVPMIEQVRYAFTQGTTYDDCSDITVQFKRDVRPWVGKTESEITVNGSVYFTDDQEDSDSGFLLRAEKDVTLTFEAELEWRTNDGSPGSTMLGLRIKRNGSLIPLSGTVNGDFCNVYNVIRINKGPVSNPGALPSPTEDDGQNREYWYATVGSTVYKLKYNGRGYEWTNTGQTEDQYFRASGRRSMAVAMKAGDQLVMVQSMGAPANYNVLNIRFVRSSFTFRWQGTGEYMDIDGISPERVLKRLVASMTGRKDIAVSISSRDARLANTCVMAAESIRGIYGARLYTSFGDFCDWMSAVFGYVHVIGTEDGFDAEVRECGGYSETARSYVDSHIGRMVSTDDIWYFPPLSRFLAHDTNNGNYYRLWPGHEDYNGSNGLARPDVLFRLNGYNPDVLCRFAPYNGYALYPIETDYTEDMLGTPLDAVRFVHRSELFDGEGGGLRYEETRDVKYSVDSGVIYSSVTAGYDRKEYNSINGRDEFNFSNTYSTGCTVTDRTLSLISKYRADSYGIEFAAQKRGEDTTDSTSDKDVFFMLCRKANSMLFPDRTSDIGNSFSGRLFNAAFSPMACIRANAGFIGLQAPEVTLRFASSTANSDIIIDGEAMSSDIMLDTPLATCGVLEFSMPDALPDGFDDGLVSVSADGLSYKGYIREADTTYARQETTTVKMIVKEVSPWS